MTTGTRKGEAFSKAAAKAAALLDRANARLGVVPPARESRPGRIHPASRQPVVLQQDAECVNCHNPIPAGTRAGYGRRGAFHLSGDPCVPTGSPQRVREASRTQMYRRKGRPSART